VPHAAPFDDPAWLFEPKYDGVRGLLYLSGREWHFRSKRGNVLRRFDQLCYWVREELGTRHEGPQARRFSNRVGITRAGRRVRCGESDQALIRQLGRRDAGVHVRGDPNRADYRLQELKAARRAFLESYLRRGEEPPLPEGGRKLFIPAAVEGETAATGGEPGTSHVKTSWPVLAARQEELVR
jgi:hypothetical protein